MTPVQIPIDPIMLSKSLDAFVSAMEKQVPILYKDVKSEWKQFIKTDIKTYLNKQKDKYSKIKTLLHTQPTYLYDIYYHLYLCTSRNAIIPENQLVSTEELTPLFQVSKYLVVQGDAGSGKSTLIKHFVLCSIYENIGIPILIELRYLNDAECTLIEYIKNKIFENLIAQNSKILDRLMNQGKFVIFLDGFDELKSEKKQQILEQINDFVNKYIECNYIITSRTYSDIQHLPLFHNYWIQPLFNSKRDTTHIAGFIRKQFKSNDNELSDKIITSIEKHINADYTKKQNYIISFLSNPLLLILYIITYKHNASIPEKKYVYYRRVIDSLFFEHDSVNKLGFERQSQCNLSKEQYEEVLRVFCLISYLEGDVDWDLDLLTGYLNRTKEFMPSIHFDQKSFIHDMKTTYNLWIDDEGQLSFIHRSIQEFYTASYIKKASESQKDKLYKLLSNKSTDRFVKSEIQNLLCLCEEMDEIGFAKYYGIPILDDLIRTLDVKGTENRVEAFLKVLLSRIPYKERNKLMYPSLVINQQVYRHSYFHFDYSNRVYLKVIEFFKTHDLSNDIVDDRYFYKNHKGQINRDFLLTENGIPRAILSKIKKSISTLVDECIKIIKQKHDLYTKLVESNDDMEARIFDALN